VTAQAERRKECPYREWHRLPIVVPLGLLSAAVAFDIAYV
jgi:hypothetical protein